jgi:hypothetical protein
MTDPEDEQQLDPDLGTSLESVTAPPTPAELAAVQANRSKRQLARVQRTERETEVMRLRERSRATGQDCGQLASAQHAECAAGTQGSGHFARSGAGGTLGHNK